MSIDLVTKILLRLERLYRQECIDLVHKYTFYHPTDIKIYRYGFEVLHANGFILIPLSDEDEAHIFNDNQLKDYQFLNSWNESRGSWEGRYELNRETGDWSFKQW